VVIANSDQTRTALLERLGLPAEKVHTVYYGNDPERFRPAQRRRAYRGPRGKLGWDDERPTLAFVGSLGDRRKGFDTAVRGMAAAGPRFRLGCPAWSVVGAGAALGHWRRAAAGLDRSIEFLGSRRCPEILRACDALVSPVRYEAYGLNVHEALCCGLPAFVTRSSGVAERYPAELTGLLIPDPDDAADLADRLTVVAAPGRVLRPRDLRPSPDSSARPPGTTWLADSSGSRPIHRVRETHRSIVLMV